ncbi:MAG: hypothetical protein KUG73_16575 [Pseudomonadales bacterium]|nr:hypothetical protein [Pseudomonadales bacterium]
MECTGIKNGYSFFGTGVIGSIYASKLAAAGSNVSVLARNRRHKQLVR